MKPNATLPSFRNLLPEMYISVEWWREYVWNEVRRNLAKLYLDRGCDMDRKNETRSSCV